MGRAKRCQKQKLPSAVKAGSVWVRKMEPLGAVQLNLTISPLRALVDWNQSHAIDSCGVKLKVEVGVMQAEGLMDLATVKSLNVTVGAIAAGVI